MRARSSNLAGLAEQLEACRPELERGIEVLSAPHLTALDRADMRRELVLRAEQCEGSANTLAGYPSTEFAAASWRARAQRIRQLIALLAVLCLAVLGGCYLEHGRIEGPPLYVHLCDAMPAADREAWGAAAGALNGEIEEAALWVGHGPPVGCSTVDVCPSGAVLADAEVREGACVITVRYAPGSAHEVARQTLDDLLRRWL